MKFTKKTITALLILIFLVGLIPLGEIPVAGAVPAYNDLNGHWAAGVINRWNDLGFIDHDIFKGASFWPNKYITRAEYFSLIINSLGATAKADIKAYTDVFSNTWQYDIVAIATQMGIANGYPDSTMRPDDTLLRQDAATLAARAMGFTSVADWNLSVFTDAAFISPYARTYVSALVERSIMQGYPGGSFRPRAFLTRAEAVKLLDNMFTNIYMPETGLRNVYLQGGLLIQYAGAELRDVIIDGDVIIGDGVGSGNVVIANCTINGRLIVRGGGPNSITLSNTTISEKIYVASFGADTRISVTDNSTVPILEAVSGFTLSGSGVAEVTILENASTDIVANLNGVSLDELNINGPGALVRLNSGHAMYAKFGDAGQNARLDMAANTSVGHLTVSAPGAIVNGTGSIRNLLINNSGAVVTQSPEFMTLGLNIIATVGGQSVSSAESQWTNNSIDRVSANSSIKVQLLPNTTSMAPFDQSSLYLSMVAGATASEAHVSQAAATRVPLTQRNGRWAYWVGFFVPAPPDAANMATVTYTYIDGEPITLPPKALDTYSGRKGLLIYLPVFREPGREAGLMKELLHINWGGLLTENIHVMSSTMYLATLNESQKATLQNDFDNMIMYSVQGGKLQYTGAEAVRRILASDNPLGLSSNSNRGLDAMNRAVSSSEARSVLEDPQFALDLTVNTSGNSQYSALSNAGKQYVAEQVLAARKTIFANPAAVKAAFDKAVQARLAAETTLLGQINSSADYAALRKIIETTANAALLQFQTGANPYKSYTNSQKDLMAEYLWRLRQYKSIQEVIDAIKKYLGDPANAPGTGGINISDLSIRRITATVYPSNTTFATNQAREVTVAVELTDGSLLTKQQVSQLISDGVITYKWDRGSPGEDYGAVATVESRDLNVYVVRCQHNGIGTQTERRDTLTFTLVDATGKRFTASAAFTAEEKRFATGISLPDRITMLCGETQIVSATLMPSNANDAVIWSISPATGIASIRTLADGRCEVIANSNNINGVAVLTATTEKGFSAKCTVTVFRNANDVVVVPTEIVLVPGSFQDITTYTYSPSSVLRWDLADGQPSIIEFTQNGRITAPIRTPQIYGDTAVVVSVVGSDPMMTATVNVRVKENTGVTIKLDHSVMYNSETQELILSVDDPDLQNQRYYVQVTGGLGGDAAKCTTAQPVRSNDRIMIEADGTNVGRVTVRLYTNPTFSGNHVGNELVIVVSPRSLSDVQFYHTATSRDPVGKVSETPYGHIMEMKLEDGPTVTPMVPAAPGQTSGPLPGYVSLTQNLTWFPYESDYNREILREVRTELVGTDYYIVGRDGNQIEVGGMPVEFFDVFRQEDGDAPRPAGGSYYWLRGYFKFGTATPTKTAIERDGHITKVPATSLEVDGRTEGGVFHSKDTRLTGLSAVAISPSRGRLTEDQLAEWGSLFYNTVNLYVAAGRVNPIIARQSEFALEEWDAVNSAWVTSATDLFADQPIQAWVTAGTHRIVDANGEQLFGSVPAIVVGDPNESSNVFHVRMLPNDLPRPSSPWLNNLDWRPPSGAGDPGAVGLIPIVPGSNDSYDYLEPGVMRSMEYPYLTARLISSTSITPDNIGVTLLGASTYMVLMSMPFPSTPPRPTGSYTAYYIVQQHSKLGFARLGTDGAVDSNRQDTVVTPEYPTSSPYVIYTLTLTAPEIYSAVVVEGDTGNVVSLSGVNDAVLNASINFFESPAPAFNSNNPSILYVDPINGDFVAHQGGSVTLSITQGAKTAVVTIVVEPAYELVMGTPIGPLYQRPSIVTAAARANVALNTNTIFESLNTAIFTVSPSPPNHGTIALADGVSIGYADLKITNPTNSASREVLLRVHVVWAPIGINPLMIGIGTQIDMLPGVGSAAVDAGIDPGTATVESSNKSVLDISPSGAVMPIMAGSAEVIITSSNGLSSTTTIVEIVEQPPGSSAPDTTAPGTTPGTAPGTTTPGTTAPGTTAPGTTAPGTTAPGTTTPAAPAITELRLRTSAAVVTNRTTRLEPYVTPYNTDRSRLQWSSSNTDVATVAAGIVSGIKSGTAVITVSDDSGNVKATCTVTVRTDAKPVTTITMSKRAMTLNVGAASTLSVSYRPTAPTLKGLTWVSNNSAVARVEPTGKVVAVSAGTATITAISDSGGRTTTCVVTVKQPVTAVTLPEAAITLSVGDTYQITPIIEPYDATATIDSATYTSGTTAVAIVSADGVVTARKAGTATITIRIDGKSTTLKVTVQ
ncbi:MAG: Ig-like domain-containing protein [Oscillospiraceae bacterium]|nr:Ig-like domain-containing protein [Oscillospiraceae bacterium]